MSIIGSGIFRITIRVDPPRTVPRVWNRLHYPRHLVKVTGISQNVKSSFGLQVKSNLSSEGLSLGSKSSSELPEDKTLELAVFTMSPTTNQAFRTPSSRFSSLPNFPYEPQYVQYGSLRIAYIDQRTGPAGSAPEIFLCLHVQLTSPYLYRHMIPVFLTHTTQSQTLCRRTIVPDLISFGRSDKPTDEIWYTFENHRKALLHLITTLNLSKITLALQDWGGILGLTLPHEKPWRFKRLIVMNTTLGTGPMHSSTGRITRTEAQTWRSDN